MSCYIYVKEKNDAAIKDTSIQPTEAWADLSPYEKLVQENERMKAEIETLHDRLAVVIGQREGLK